MKDPDLVGVISTQADNQQTFPLTVVFTVWIVVSWHSCDALDELTKFDRSQNRHGSLANHVERRLTILAFLTGRRHVEPFFVLMHDAGLAAGQGNLVFQSTTFSLKLHQALVVSPCNDLLRKQFLLDSCFFLALTSDFVTFWSEGLICCR